MTTHVYYIQEYELLKTRIIATGIKIFDGEDAGAFCSFYQDDGIFFSKIMYKKYPDLLNFVFETFIDKIGRTHDAILINKSELIGTPELLLSTALHELCHFRYIYLMPQRVLFDYEKAIMNMKNQKMDPKKMDKKIGQVRWLKFHTNCKTDIFTDMLMLHYREKGSLPFPDKILYDRSLFYELRDFVKLKDRKKYESITEENIILNLLTEIC